MPNTSIHPKLKKYIWEKITDDLRYKNVISHTNEVWVLDLDSKEWYITILAEGETWYNQSFFNLHLNLFSITHKELSSILKEWVEKNFQVRLTNISRRQSNMTYIIDGMLASKKGKWNLNNRFGFSYEFVKKFLDVKNQNPDLVVENIISFR